MANEFLPGTLVRARGREWVVQNGSEADWLVLRPLGGSEEDIVSLLPELEHEGVVPATFPAPTEADFGSYEGALLMTQALRLQSKSGAGPFRSFGKIAVEPRSYQLVPLLMALRLDPVRLLVADDVGVGKTIEAGLIARELLDRGEISTLAVLCPPHLVDQWQTELSTRFHIQAAALTSSSAARLERGLAHGQTLFDQFQAVVVSLDYIKSDRHRNHFLSIAPKFVIVDEAHTCASSGVKKQQRFQLLQELTKDPERHLLMLTATPHSGDEEAFSNLLTLLDPDFAELKEDIDRGEHTKLRERLARHFVQRRRKDIDEWQQENLDRRTFPVKMATELTYNLTGRWGQFFDKVQEYCLNLAQSLDQGENGKSNRLVWYATLALLRCASSSPASAVQALTKRLDVAALEIEDSELAERLRDGSEDDQQEHDLEPPADLGGDDKLQELIELAGSLKGIKDDPKLAALVPHLEGLVKDGFAPVVFCRYIATARYVHEMLEQAFKKSDVTMECITGEYTPDERRERIENLKDSEQKILVATDCLSEGINLQDQFNAVVHYDLAWNPTRHEQREGRVDRFGQQAPEVRCTLLYGADNPVDGFILQVILRKAETIRKELGIMVPMPEDEARFSQALLQAALMKKRRQPSQPVQLTLDFGEAEKTLAPVTLAWENALEKAKANRTIFAQRALRPDEVLPQWQRQMEALGGHAETLEFVQLATARMQSAASLDRSDRLTLETGNLPAVIRDRLAEIGITKRYRVRASDFHRSHPLVEILAEQLLAETQDGNTLWSCRASTWSTASVSRPTAIYVIRLRHQLHYTRRHVKHQMMAEEITLVGVPLNDPTRSNWSDASVAMEWLRKPAAGNISESLGKSETTKSLALWEKLQEPLGAWALERAEILKSEHVRVREAARDVGQYEVKASLPLDLMAVYTLLPDEI